MHRKMAFLMQQMHNNKTAVAEVCKDIVDGCDLDDLRTFSINFDGLGRSISLYSDDLDDDDDPLFEFDMYPDTGELRTTRRSRNGSKRRSSRVFVDPDDLDYDYDYDFDDDDDYYEPVVRRSTSRRRRYPYVGEDHETINLLDVAAEYS